MSVNLGKNTSLALIAAGVVLVLVALIEHFTVKVEILPHLAVVLIALALVLGGIGLWGYMAGSAR
jgi:uncharacterized membrane protein YidH (DUF202 family)